MSSDYAQIADVTPVREGSARARIYEEIGELASSGERNIFGVKLRSSFQRANALPTKSQLVEEPDVAKHSATVSSFKPAGTPPVKKQLSSEQTPTRPEPQGKAQPTNTATTKPDEPIYAKPNKPLKQKPLSTTGSAQKKADVKTTVDKFKKPPPTFSPPPPPGDVKRRDGNSQEANDPTYALPCDNLESTDKEKTAKVVIAESEYAQIDDEVLARLKKESDTSATKCDSDDDHTYYIADSLSRSESQNNDVDNSKEADVSVPQDEDKSATQTSNKEAETQDKTASKGSFDAIDVSQVVRRKRGSHVTNSFSEDSIDTTDANDATAVQIRGRLSTSERRANFRSKLDDDIAEDTCENNEVFLKESENEERSKQEGKEVISYGKALESVIDSMINSEQDNTILNGPFDNGEAFTSLKEYLMKNSNDGFDLESHIPSCGDPVARLQTILSQ